MPSPKTFRSTLLYEDEYLAVVNKPAGMMVHAGAGVTDEARNRGTLVNALLHHLQSAFGSRRRAAARDRASAGQADQRRDCGRQGRRDASQAGRDVFANAG